MNKTTNIPAAIGKAVRDTVQTNELGYTPESRATLAAALGAFAQTLDARCDARLDGERVTVCGDVWRLIAELHDPEGMSP